MDIFWFSTCNRCMWWLRLPMMLCSSLHLCKRSDPVTCCLITFSIFTHLPMYTSAMCFYDFADKNYVHSAPKTARGCPNGKQQRCQRFAAASAPPSCLSSWKVWKCFFFWVESVETKRQTPSRLEKYVRSGAHLNQNRGRCSVLLLICLPLSLLCVSFSLRLPIFISRSFFSFCCPLPLLTLFPLCALSAPHRYLITIILFLKNARTVFLSNLLLLYL